MSPGDSLRLSGAKFTKQTGLRLALVGLEGRIELGTVRIDAAGAFQTTLLVPATASPGQYRLIAVATDGDE
ncbi:MAG: hypothetical protein ACREN5_03060, partial [Gemmatimonadales bacterium]